MVSIRNFNRFDCGGALIGAHTVLTAAQCVDERHGRDRLPYLWLNSTRTETFTETTRPRQAVDVRIHPNYTGDIFDGNDFAILMLNESAEPLSSIEPEDPQYNVALPGTNLSFLGFGRSTRSSSRSPYLQLTIYDILSPTACKNSEDIIFHEHGMLCMEGNTPCSGDQGGPLFIDRGAGYGNILYGIVSATMCDLNSRLVAIPTVNEPEISKWILDTRKEFEERATGVSDFDPVAAFFAALEAAGSTIGVDDIPIILYGNDE
eukprot:g120.t1